MLVADKTYKKAICHQLKVLTERILKEIWWQVADHFIFLFPSRWTNKLTPPS
jgi:hypothetical protein